MAHLADQVETTCPFQKEYNDGGSDPWDAELDYRIAIKG